jgi:hypothetical protein
VTGLNQLIGSQPSWLLDLQWQYRCKQTIRNLHTGLTDVFYFYDAPFKMCKMW